MILKMPFLGICFCIALNAAKANGNDTTIVPKGVIPIDSLITPGTVVDSGLVNVYTIGERYYFELDHSLLNKDVLLVTRIFKGAAEVRDTWGIMGYGGDAVNNCVLRFEEGPQKKIFLKQISYSEYSKDSSAQMFRSVANSNLQPIVASFDIKALPKDRKGYVIDVTDYLNGDDDAFFIGQSAKKSLQIGGIQIDKSFVQSIKSFKNNIEIKTVKTYSKNSSNGYILNPAITSTSMTLELNTSLVLLPEDKMMTRRYDERVGYFNVGYLDYDENPQGVKRISYIKKWRLEPKPEDIEKYKNGILVEPKKPIVFYIDPATPSKWVPYLIQGVNDWQKAFEKAGFKNAIYARKAPDKTEDSTWSLEDSRYSAIVYKASIVPNASGPSIADPRTGEILESHINWYHNVMQLLHGWYMVQIGPTDSRARKMEFDEDLMGQLIRFVSSHEVGHTLGLRHNFGSSSTVPVDSLRNKNWLDKNGHTPSIMDYARFNYVAQPEDSITASGLFPRIGDYDNWAIEWGYRLFPEKKRKDEQQFLNQWIISKTKNKRLWFGSELNVMDPRSQSEALGDNAMKASAYGIKNLKRVIPNLEEWTKVSGENYANLKRIYQLAITQYITYIGHVVRNIGGQYGNPKTVDEEGVVYAVVPKNIQKNAMAFLDLQLFQTPTWLLNTNILAKVGMDAIDIIGSAQSRYLSYLLSSTLLSNLISSEVEASGVGYPAIELMNDLQSMIWRELYQQRKIDVFRRNLQKQYVTQLIALYDRKAMPSSDSPLQLPPGFEARVVNPNPGRSDVSSFALAKLTSLSVDIKKHLPYVKDQTVKFHLLDILHRIDDCLLIK